MPVGAFSTFWFPAVLKQVNAGSYGRWFHWWLTCLNITTLSIRFSKDQESWLKMILCVEFGNWHCDKNCTLICFGKLYFQCSKFPINSMNSLFELQALQHVTFVHVCAHVCVCVYRMCPYLLNPGANHRTFHHTDQSSDKQPHQRPTSGNRNLSFCNTQHTSWSRALFPQWTRGPDSHWKRDAHMLKSWVAWCK